MKKYLTPTQLAELCQSLPIPEAEAADRAAKAIDLQMVYAIKGTHIYRKVD